MHPNLLNELMEWNTDILMNKGCMCQEQIPCHPGVDGDDGDDGIIWLCESLNWVGRRPLTFFSERLL